MLTTVYALSFFVSLSGLILWFYYQDRPRVSRRMSQLFLGGFLVYTFSLAFADGELGQKFLILFRDLLVLGLVSQFFGFFRKHKPIFFAMLAILYGAFWVKGFDYMKQSLVQQLPPVTDQPTSVADWDNGELLVDLKNPHDRQSYLTLFSELGLRHRPAFQMDRPGQTELDDFVLVDLPDDRRGELREIIRRLETSNAVDYVEDNDQVQIDDPTGNHRDLRRIPNNPYQLDDPHIDKLWAFEALRLDQFYTKIRDGKLKPKKKARIFILDTGVDAAHEDIADKYQSVRKKYDTDAAGHGTHCAGIAAAVSNNGKGIASFAPDGRFVTVSSIKVLNGFGAGTQQGIINGILEAADQGADVISLSLGGRSTASRRKAYTQAVQYANEAGAIVVVAAGNSNMNAREYAPANTPGAITVTAIDTSLNRASFSNFVQDLERGIAAPGVAIYSTIPKNKYATFNGTSMATPYVAGLLGIMKSLDPDLTTDQAYERLHQSGLETGQTNETGRLIQPAGVLD